MEETVLVAGAGTMGAGIAFVAARGGYTVDLVEPDPSTRERAQASIAEAAQAFGQDDDITVLTLKFEGLEGKHG